MSLITRVLARADQTAHRRFVTAAKSVPQIMEIFREEGLPEPVKGTDWRSKEDLENILMRHFYKKQNEGQDPPEFIKPMLLHNLRDKTQGEQEEIWESEEWFYEPKRNGTRCLWYMGPKNEFRSRGRSDIDFQITDLNRNGGMEFLNIDVGDYAGTVLDGEVISTLKQVDSTPYTKGKGGTVTNNVLQAVGVMLKVTNAFEMQSAYGWPLRFIIYDIAKYKGEDVGNIPYWKRRDLMTEVFVALQDKLKGHAELNDSSNMDKKRLYEEYVAQGGEGGVMKHKDAPYQPGKRTREMLKVKKEFELDAVVTGYVKPKKGKPLENNWIGGLVFSAKDVKDGAWHEVAAVANLSDQMMEEYTDENPDGSKNGELKEEVYGQIWEVSGMEWTAKGRISHARMVRRRDQPGPDQKDIEDVVYDRDAMLRELEEKQTASIANVVRLYKGP